MAAEGSNLRGICVDSEPGFVLLDVPTKTGRITIQLTPDAGFELSARISSHSAHAKKTAR